MDETEFFLHPGFELPSRTSAEYFGVLSMYEPAAQAMLDRFNGTNLHAHFASGAPAEAAQLQTQAPRFNVTEDGIALLVVNGPTMKYVSSMTDGTSTVQLRQALRTARRDPKVRGAMLVMDTPGGTVRGNQDLADEVMAFAAAKPIYAYVEDMTASAGVSVASQATKRFANNATALYGAMGTYSVLVDESRQAEALGVKLHVIRAGAFKGMGTPGTAITEEQLSEAQRIVDSMNENYLNMIARGTKLPLEVVRSLADGRVIMAADALAAGLIDGVQTFEQTYAQLVAALGSTRSAVPASPQLRSEKMSQEKTPATLAELKATFGNSTADWRESQIEAGNSVAEAAVAYAKFVESNAKAQAESFAAQLAASKEAAQKATDEAVAAAVAKSGGLGHNPVGEGNLRNDFEGSEHGDAVDTFNAKVAKAAGANPDLSRRQRAVRAVATSNPELYAAYMLATNPGRRQERLITEKLESVGR